MMCASRILSARHTSELAGNVAPYSAHAAWGSRSPACCSMQRRSSEPPQHLGVVDQPEALRRFGESSSQRTHSPPESAKGYHGRTCVSGRKQSSEASRVSGHTH
eukprot:3071594-Pleurochrysis_carterae.AAC.1